MTQSRVKNPDFEDLIKLPLKAAGVHVVSPANYVDSHGWVFKCTPRVGGLINANYECIYWLSFAFGFSLLMGTIHVFFF